MTDPRLVAYRQAAAAMRRGLFNVALPLGSHGDAGALGRELGRFAATLEQPFEQDGQLLRVTEKADAGLFLEDVLDHICCYFRNSVPCDRIGCALMENA